MNISKKEKIQLIASLVLVVVTAYYAWTSNRMVSLMQKTNIGDLRPYLFIKLLSPSNQPYFSYKGNGQGILYYTLNNNGKVTANNIVRSYKVYKIDKSNKISITRPTYVNIDFVFSLPPQEQLEGQPDTIDGINLQESDINNSYYIIELWINYEGVRGINEASYCSSIGIEVRPLECNKEGNWKYGLYLKHRGEGIDQNLKEFWQWYNSDKPLNIKKREQLANIYLKNKIKEGNMGGLYWIIAGIMSLFVGISFYYCLVNPKGDDRLRVKLCQGWNHAICFFVGVGGILYYFIKVRFQQINNGATLSLSDIILIIFFLMSSIGLMPYFLTNITKGIEAILKRILEK